MIVAGLDIGNQTTEIALARVEPDGEPVFLASALVPTTGIKSTTATIPGALQALSLACDEAGLGAAAVDLIRINQAAPVISGLAMQAITETILTDSLLVGHNPETPGGAGLGAGTTTDVRSLLGVATAVIAVVPATVPFEEAATLIRVARENGFDVRGAIVERDDGVLIANRIGSPPIPIVDEVTAIDRVPLGEFAAVEVAVMGTTVQTLCNPYGLAAIFALDAGTTARIAPAARALTGLRSAVVIRTPQDCVEPRSIALGFLSFAGDRGERKVDVGAGARELMNARSSIGLLQDVRAEPGTATGAMFAELRNELGTATGLTPSAFRVSDVLAADLVSRQPVAGGLSREVAPERAVALAAMIHAGLEFSTPLAAALEEVAGIRVEIGGTEAEAGILGALTTPGAGTPLCVVDLGSGSTNAARIDANGKMSRVHLAGGGSLVDLMIGEELGIDDPAFREAIKRARCARIDSLYAIRHEDGSVEFSQAPLPLDLFGRSVIQLDGFFRAIPGNPSIESVVAARRRAKAGVFGANVDRALRELAPGGNPRSLGFVVLIGGTALDFELPGMLADQLSAYGIVTGTANVRGSMGPRNAVATGLVHSVRNRS